MDEGKEIMKISEKRHRAPRMKYGNFLIRYYQEPYVDRFVEVRYNGDCFLEIKGHVFRTWIKKIQKNDPYGDVCLNVNIKSKLKSFLFKMDEHDKWLDRDVK